MRASLRRHSAETIARQIADDIVGHRLLPGARLIEARLGLQYGVSRTVIREALHLLASEKLVVLAPDRGASIARPSVAETRALFATRRLIEGAMIRQFAGTADAPALHTLEAHLAAEQAAVQREDVPGRTRLLADFHVLIAQSMGNMVLAQVIAELVARSSLITLLYQTRHAARDSSAEHLGILAACRQHDADLAERLMLDHLDHVEASLVFSAAELDALPQRTTPRHPHDPDSLSA